MLVHVLIALAVIGLAIGLAWLLHRGRKQDGEPEIEDLPDYRVVLSFVGSAYGLLLGLLVSFAVGHYSDARHRAEDEAATLIALYNAVAIYPQETRVGFQHDLVCYMDSVVEGDWPSMQDGNDVGSARTLAVGDALRAEVRRLPLGNERESSAAGTAASLMTEAGEARQNLLFFTRPEIPNVIWVVVYVGAFLIVFLIAMNYHDHRRGRLIALGTVTVLVTVVVGVLAMLDRPFGIGTSVDPDEMKQAITLLSTGAEPGVLRPCRELAPDA